MRRAPLEEFEACFNGLGDPRAGNARHYLLAHHLKALRLPTFLREYDKNAVSPRILRTATKPPGLSSSWHQFV
jgi:hypothetical protein|tara:strand:- start:241 stop:459 length:219 start_codon:yes stop_codon:yes gene_type:complete